MNVCEIKHYPSDGELRTYEDGTLVKCFRVKSEMLRSVRVKLKDERVFYFYEVKESELFDLIQQMKAGEYDNQRCQPIEFTDEYLF